MSINKKAQAKLSVSKKFKKGDTVIVTAGKDKGKVSVLQQILPNYRAKVEGVQMIKRHVKPNPQKNEEGGIISGEASIHLSNLAIYNPDLKKADKVAFILKDGRKFRVFKSNNKEIM